MTAFKFKPFLAAITAVLFLSGCSGCTRRQQLENEKKKKEETAETQSSTETTSGNEVTEGEEMNMHARQLADSIQQFRDSKTFYMEGVLQTGEFGPSEKTTYERFDDGTMYSAYYDLKEGEEKLVTESYFQNIYSREDRDVRVIPEDVNYDDISKPTVFLNDEPPEVKKPAENTQNDEQNTAEPESESENGYEEQQPGSGGEITEENPSSGEIPEETPEPTPTPMEEKEFVPYTRQFFHAVSTDSWQMVEDGLKDVPFISELQYLVDDFDNVKVVRDNDYTIYTYILKKGAETRFPVFAAWQPNGLLDSTPIEMNVVIENKTNNIQSVTTTKTTKTEVSTFVLEVKRIKNSGDETSDMTSDASQDTQEKNTAENQESVEEQTDNENIEENTVQSDGESGTSDTGTVE